MQVLFLSQPFEPRAVDSAFSEESEAAQRAGLSTALIDVDALDTGAFDRAGLPPRLGTAPFYEALAARSSA